MKLKYIDINGFGVLVDEAIDAVNSQSKQEGIIKEIIYE